MMFFAMNDLLIFVIPLTDCCYMHAISDHLVTTRRLKCVCPSKVILMSDCLLGSSFWIGHIFCSRSYSILLRFLLVSSALFEVPPLPLPVNRHFVGRLRQFFFFFFQMNIKIYHIGSAQ